LVVINIAFFGSSLVSAYWNGAATYYGGIIRALAARGHRVTFYESDAYDRQKHRDIPGPPWAKVVVYSSTDTDAVWRALDDAADADLIVKASGNGVYDELLEAAVPGLKRPGNVVAFWDVDAPATLERLDANAADPFTALIPRDDVVLTCGGGEPVTSAYEARGDACRSTTRSTRARTTRSLATRGSPATSASSATACRTARHASTRSSSAPRRCCPTSDS
jgi:spore maturation protein CgeB